MYLWRSEDDFAGCHQIGPGDWAQIATFGDRYSYLLSQHHQPRDTENLHTECCFYKTEIKLWWGCFYRKESIDGPGSRLQFKTRKVNFLILQRDTQLNFNFRIGKKKSLLIGKKEHNNQEYPLLCSKIKEMTDFLLVPVVTAILPWVFQIETLLPRKCESMRSDDQTLRRVGALRAYSECLISAFSAQRPQSTRLEKWFGHSLRLQSLHMILKISVPHL